MARTLYEVNVSEDDPDTISALPYLKDIPELRRISVSGKRVSKVTMDQIGKATQIEEIHLESLDITDEKVLALKRLAKLKQITIYNCPIGDAALTAFEDCKYLELVELTDTNINGSGLSSLSQSKDLKELQLRASPITDDSMDKITNFKKLSRLCITDAKVTKAGLFKLADMHLLEFLQTDYFPKAVLKELGTRAIKSRQAARAAGEPTAPDDVAPGAESLQDWE